VNYEGAPPPGAGQFQGLWSGRTGNEYAGGANYFSFLDGISWFEGEGDLHFQTYVNVVLALDHFKCYEAKGQAPRETVDLEDEFGKEPKVRVGKPAFFCNPVNKNGEGILNPEVHLTCYEIERKGEKRDVVVENQFGEQTLTVEEPELLCLPSGKTAVVPHKD